METIIVKDLMKTFKLSKKQMKINQTSKPIKVAIRNINFSTFSGEIFGLLGANGAGKTTTLRCIATLIKPDNGEIIIQGINSKNDLEIRRKIGFLTNELKLEDQFTPNYLYNYFSSLHNIDKSIIEERKKYIFETFGIEKFSETKIGDLSSGMKQKVSIAVSLVHDPEIIIFDEPTNGLDVLTAKVVTDFLLQLRDQGKTVIISTHIMNIVEKLCDRVGIIIDGELKVCDSVKNVLKSNESKELEEVFFKLYSEAVGE